MVYNTPMVNGIPVVNDNTPVVNQLVPLAVNTQASIGGQNTDSAMRVSGQGSDESMAGSIN